MNSQLKHAGVTLIELLTVISIATILMMIAVPSYKYVTTANRISAEINGLMGDMQFARYEAIKEGLLVQICPTATSTSSTCDGTTNWSVGGWIVLSNPSDNPNNTVAVVLRRQLPFTSLNSSDTLSTTTGITTVIFNREGFATTGAAAFSLHDPTNTSSYTRCLILGAAGAMTTTTSGNTLYGETCT